MSIERLIHCDAEGCETWQRLSPGTKIPKSWYVVVTESRQQHYCAPNCLLRELAKFPASERVEFTDEEL